jgi:UDP-2-acetamido-2,6-beta-L-arabino-hexul-4-ose reductase
MIRVGITGSSGFIGKHLIYMLGLKPEKYILIEFKKEYFEDTIELDRFSSQCDVIVHLAGINRHSDENYIFRKNVDLAQKLAESLIRVNNNCHIVYSSSTQQDLDNQYGRGKRAAFDVLKNWAISKNGKLTALLIPNVFGPFCKPDYNSFIATFCANLIDGKKCEVINDSSVGLIYVGDLSNFIINIIDNPPELDLVKVEPTNVEKVSAVLNKLLIFRDEYYENGVIPLLESSFDLKLFNTFRSYIDYQKIFPRYYKLNSDNRGTFVELIRLNVGGQVSFSTTYPGITRGNHYHTRKIERFSVISGTASIKLRRIDTNEVLEFICNGKNPSYVDMPVMYTHNITNIGEDELVTVFWINELFDQSDPDTFFLNV